MSPVISRDKLHYTDGERRLTREKAVPEPLFPPQIQTGMGSNSGLRGKRPATNRLNRGTARLQMEQLF